jgi:hypothetical protein
MKNLNRNGKLDFKMQKDKIKIENLEEEEEIEESNLLFKIIKTIIALLLLFSFIYFSGFREYFFFSKTSPDEEINSIEAVTETELETINLPVDIFIVKGPVYGTERSKESIDSLIKNTSNILNQAEIKLEIEEIRENDLDKEELNLLLSGNFDFFELKEDRLSIILMKKLDGLNGVAYPNRGVTMVGDYTTGKDYRTLAHEIGHLLGLSHTKEHNYVMTQGKNGYLFSKEEIKTMRKYFNE